LELVDAEVVVSDVVVELSVVVVVADVVVVSSWTCSPVSTFSSGGDAGLNQEAAPLIIFPVMSCLLSIVA
jgi:hypothetical protein